MGLLSNARKLLSAVVRSTIERITYIGDSWRYWLLKKIINAYTWIRDLFLPHQGPLNSDPHLPGIRRRGALTAPSLRRKLSIVSLFSKLPIPRFLTSFIDGDDEELEILLPTEKQSSVSLPLKIVDTMSKIVVPDSDLIRYTIKSIFFDVIGIPVGF